MAEAAHDHPGFRWIMRFLPELVRDFPMQWVVADATGYVAASASQDELLAGLRDREPAALAIVFIDPAIMRGNPAPRHAPAGSAG